jgi:hypothetical protein
MVEPKAKRLREFFRRLGSAPSAASEIDALQLLAHVLTAVEDELTDVPANPDAWMTDGRMYPPQADSRRKVQENDRVARFRSRGHNTFIGQNGAIEIRTLDGDILFFKAGADGRHVWEQ